MLEKEIEKMKQRARELERLHQYEEADIIWDEIDVILNQLGMKEKEN